MRKELGNILEKAIRTSKETGGFSLSEDERKTLDELEKAGRLELQHILETLRKELSLIIHNKEQDEIAQRVAFTQQQMLEEYDEKAEAILRILKTERAAMEAEKRNIEQLRNKYYRQEEERIAAKPDSLPKFLLLTSCISFGLSCLYYIWIAWETQQQDVLQLAMWNALATAVSVALYDREIKKKMNVS
eukprot:jgi/Galph1/3688/GphlegSOOS_G2369.1